jgi:hypothetical protein
LPFSLPCLVAKGVNLARFRGLLSLHMLIFHYFVLAPKNFNEDKANRPSRKDFGVHCQRQPMHEAVPLLFSPNTLCSLFSFVLWCLPIFPFWSRSSPRCLLSCGERCKSPLSS